MCCSVNGPGCLVCCMSNSVCELFGETIKINDLKTKFIVFRSPQLRCDSSGLSVNVGESQITPSLKVILRS